MVPSEAAFDSYEDALDKIMDTVNRLKQGEFPEDEDKLNALKIFRQYTVDINPAKYYFEPNKRKILIFYLIRTIVNEFWKNLGGDSSFGIETLKEDAALFTINLGMFIDHAINKNIKSDSSEFNSLLKTIEVLFDAVSKVRHGMTKVKNDA